MLCFFFCSEGAAGVCWEIFGEDETVYFTFFRKQLEEMGGKSSRQSRTAPDGQRETASCENHPAKAEGARDGVTSFPGRISLRFLCISKPGTFLARTVLQEPQRRRVRAANLDRDQISRPLQEGTRKTTRTKENNRENTRKVPRRSQECLNC